MCKSGNIISLEYPKILLDQMVGEYDPTIKIDECIVPVIQKLWDNEIITLESCCGHGRKRPHVVISTIENMLYAGEIINEVDNRSWEIHKIGPLTYYTTPSHSFGKNEVKNHFSLNDISICFLSDNLHSRKILVGKMVDGENGVRYGMSEINKDIVEKMAKFLNGQLL